MAGLRKVRAGDPLVVSAGAWNAFIDAARAHQTRQHDVHRALKTDFRQTGIVLVKNASGYDCPRFGVLGLAGPLVDPADDEAEFAQRVVLNGVSPTVPAHSGAFVVPLVPILQGEFGKACIDGVCVAKITITDEDHGYADVSGGSLVLTSVPAGTAQILWKQPPEDRVGGVALAIVRLGGGAAAPEPAQTALVPVYLRKTAGDGGDADTAPSWQYSLWTLDLAPGYDDPVAVEKQPHRPTTVGLYQFAPNDSLGIALFTAMIGWQLLWAQEQWVLGPCEATPQE